MLNVSLKAPSHIKPDTITIIEINGKSQTHKISSKTDIQWQRNFHISRKTRVARVAVHGSDSIDEKILLGSTGYIKVR